MENYEKNWIVKVMEKKETRNIAFTVWPGLFKKKNHSYWMHKFIFLSEEPKENLEREINEMGKL